MPNQSESGRNRNERKAHDRKARAYALMPSDPFHLSKAARLVVLILTVVVVIALTAFFAGGFFHL